MKNLYVLSGMIALGSIAGLNAMKRVKDEHPAAYQMIDALIPEDRPFAEIDWPAIFKILDLMVGVIDVNEYREKLNGETLLILAIQGKKLLAAKTLLEKYKANPNLPNIFPNIPMSDNKGTNPLTFACFADDLPMAKLLLHYGADPFIKDGSGHDSFYYATLSPSILTELKKLKK